MPDSEKDQLWMTALRMLAASQKSRSALSKKLSDKGYPAQAVREALDELEKKGILNDRAFAQDLLTRFSQGQLSGRRRIGFELQKRGIPPEVREEMLGGLSDEGERERARELFENRWGLWKNLAPEKRRKKVFDFLLRRGFDFQIVRELMEQRAGKDDESYD